MITGSQKPGFSHLWVFYGFFMGFYGFFMGFLWVFMGFLWKSLFFFQFWTHCGRIFPLKPSMVFCRDLWCPMWHVWMPVRRKFKSLPTPKVIVDGAEVRCLKETFHILWSGGQDFRACRARWRDQGLHGAAIHKMVSDVHNALGKRDRIDPAKVGSLTQKDWSSHCPYWYDNHWVIN